MAEEKKEPWLNYLALTTVILAVCATLATFKGGGYSTRSVLSQAQESDKWAYYQSKSIKSYMYDMQKEKLELELASAKFSPGVKAAYEKKIKEYGDNVTRYDTEKLDIKKEAEILAATKVDAQRHGKQFGYSVIFLQIAILLSSIAALMKKKVVWVVGVSIGAVGLVFFANGFFLFFG
jgi:hypothetical protein